MIWYFMLLSGIIISILWYKWSKKVGKFSSFPTSKYNIPIFGHVFRVPFKLENLLKFQQLMYSEVQSKTRVLWLFFRPILTTKDVVNVENVLKSSVHISKGNLYKLAKPWLGDGLLFSDGEKWKTRRRLLTPAFHFDILTDNFSIVNHHADEFVEYLKKTFIHKPMDMSKVAKYFSLNVICETAMGVRHNIYKTTKPFTREGKYVEAVDKLLPLLLSRILKPWLSSLFVYKHFSSEGKTFYKCLKTARCYVESIIEKRIESLNTKTLEKANIFLDILIAAHKKGEIDVEGIIEEVNTFMFEGHDTVSSAIAWTVFLLGRNKEIQQKVFDEIENYDISSITMDMLTECIYFDCVIKESLRLHSPVPGISRLIQENLTLPNGSVVPANTALGFHILHMHRDESYWEDPLKFYPERFLNKNREKQNPFLYVPFSAGPRNCIGQRFAMMELKVILFYLVKNFRFVSLHKEDEIKEHVNIIHRSVNGIWVKIFPRK